MTGCWCERCQAYHKKILRKSTGGAFRLDCLTCRKPIVKGEHYIAPGGAAVYCLECSGKMERYDMGNHHPIGGTVAGASEV